MKILGLTLPYQILTGIALGVVCGLFFGDMMAPLIPVGDAFILLLKMAILPYLTFALMHGIGSLQLVQAKRLLKYGAIFLLPIWVIVLGTMYAMTLSFPPQLQISHFSAHHTPETDPDAVVKLFIPGNIFEALSNNIVPAVVIFSLFFGAALMVIKKKEEILNVLDSAVTGLSRITRWVIQLSPLGVFALIGSTVGTVPWHQLEKLAVYLIVIIAASIFFVFWALPVLLTSLTPIRYRVLIKDLQPALLIGFSTGNIFVALPYVMDAISAVSAEHAIENEESRMIGKTVIPIAYNLPLVGNLMAMFFILFLAYFYAYEFDVGDYIKLTFASVLTLAGPITAGLNSVAFLIDEMGLPKDGLRLYAETWTITRNFQAFAGVGGIAVFTLLTLFAFTKQLRLQLRRALVNGGITLGVLAGLVTVLAFVQPSPPPLKPIWPSLTIESDVKVTVYKPEDVIPPRNPKEAGETSLDRILREGQLWIGYTVPSLPFAYFNEHGELVGYAIAYAYDLANALGVDLIFVPYQYYEDIASDLDNDTFDIATTAIAVTAKRLKEMAFTRPTFTAEVVFVVLDKEREKYVNWEEVAKQEGLRLGVLKDSIYYTVAKEKFPKADIIPLESYNQALDDPSIEALLWSNQEGLTWSLLHPAYTVVSQTPPIDRWIYAFSMKKDEPELLSYVNYWMTLRDLQGFNKEQREKWILGETGEKRPHWSILRNVFGVGEEKKKKGSQPTSS